MSCYLVFVVCLAIDTAIDGGADGCDLDVDAARAEVIEQNMTMMMIWYIDGDLCECVDDDVEVVCLVVCVLRLYCFCGCFV